MANSKNTIQNIPLEAELCMNSLKTEVKPFKGYNEKNTTFYGGTLSPIYDKTTELFNKDNSYTFFNSKGEAFTLVKEDDEIHLYKGSERVGDVSGEVGTKTEKLDVTDVDNVVMAAKCPDGTVLSVYKNRDLYINNVLKEKLLSLDLKNDSSTTAVDCQVYFFEDKVIFTVCFVGLRETESGESSDLTKMNRIEVRIFCLDEDKNLHTFRYTPSLDVYQGKVPVFAFTAESEPGFVRTCMTYPWRTKSSYGTKYTTYNYRRFYQIIRIDLNTYIAGTNLTTGKPDEFFYEDIYEPGTPHHIMPFSDATDFMLMYNEAARFAGRYVGGFRRKPSGSTYYLYNDAYNYNGTGWYIPIESSDDITCPLGNYSSNASIYYLNGNLISIGIGGRPIIPCLSFSSNIITPYRTDDEYAISYKKGENWYCFHRFPIDSNTGLDSTKIIQYLKSLVVDNRYVFVLTTDGGYVVDVEHIDEGWKICSLDWILSDPVLSMYCNLKKEASDSTEKTVPDTYGVVYGAGVNAGYMVSNAELIGYLPNPYVGKVFKRVLSNEDIAYRSLDAYYKIPNLDDNTQYYWNIGDTSQSAKYKGTDIEYEGTLYPIDQNGNVVLPISQNAEIIKGYSNNDMVKEGNTVYPLMYWNNNQKTYSYMLLSSMENVTDVFSFQGQQYSVDDKNIYAINFNSGVISNVNAVAYKKNLTFLGTLPTQAVFWSEFNKTFYAFTGDRILSRMFEASDINKIHFVGQNPSSLSLWICTDSGVYVLSDSDMYKLDFESKQVSFQPKTALIVTEGETNNECHAISLYLKKGEQGEMIPVKLQTAYYGLGGEMKAVMDCWYIRLFDKDRTEGYVKVKVNTITDVTRHTEEKTFKVNPSDYDDNNIFYLRYQPKYQECVSMQLELETNLGIYQISLGVNTTDSTAQVSKFNF